MTSLRGMSSIYPQFTMTTHGSSCVIFNNKSEVLLGLRNDFRVWGLPGGMVDAGETFEQAAMRETHEETGYIVEIARQVGDYHRPQHDNIQHAYIARIVGGDPSKHSWETVELRWFAPARLPLRLAPAIKHIVADATANYAEPVQREIRFGAFKQMLFRIAITWRKFYQRRVRGPWSN